MNSRVEKYNYTTDEAEVPSRFEKNRELYNNVDITELSRVKTNSNVRILEPAPKTIDIEKIKKYIEERNEEPEGRKRIVVKEEISNLNKPVAQEKRDYDINSVLEKAKQSRETYYEDEKHKKLRDTQYDILSKIKMYDEETPKEKEKSEFNTDEKTLIDLINTVTLNKKSEDLLSELKGDANKTIITAPINEENKDEFIKNAISDKLETPLSVENIKTAEETKPNEENTIVKNLDKSFYTNSSAFSKQDFEGFEELEKKVKKNNTLVKIGVIILILLALGTIYAILKYVLNIF